MSPDLFAKLRDLTSYQRVAEQAGERTDQAIYDKIIALRQECYAEIRAEHQDLFMWMCAAGLLHFRYDQYAQKKDRHIQFDVENAYFSDDESIIVLENAKGWASCSVPAPIFEFVEKEEEDEEDDGDGFHRKNMK